MAETRTRANHYGRFTKMLGLNPNGLSRNDKKKVVWKKFVRDKYLRSKEGRSQAVNVKRSDKANPLFDKFTTIHGRFQGSDLKGFLHNPSAITKLKKEKRRAALRNLKKSHHDIELLKHKFSVAIPSKKALQLLTVLGKFASGIVEVKTSNHGFGYWSYLLTQKGVTCRVYNFHQSKNGKNQKEGKEGKNKKKATKKPNKSKATLAEEAKQFIEIKNGECTAEPSDVLKDFRSQLLLMIYPDFVLDHDHVSKLIKQKKQVMIQGQEVIVDPEKLKDDDLSWGGNPNDKIKYSSSGHVNQGRKGGELPSVKCLKAFKGNYVVHIGELFGSTWDSKNVWGKTTSMIFQIELQSKFHKIHQMEMARWPMFRDTLTVWKRNKVDKVGQDEFINLDENEIEEDFDTGIMKHLVERKTAKLNKEQLNNDALNLRKDDRKRVKYEKGKFAYRSKLASFRNHMRGA